ncbi:hypothetical protein JTE90_003175 [Oedothorax gibbosus]|uniref:Uncharacterized protein n=1 Tax=Oedothorax gibbosus TaxID=931172 RepID=A0AAV6UPT1_9ARAC|nr:hypothetical protein JTE90_003175 [Oedothorax gibbosus]
MPHTDGDPPPQSHFITSKIAQLLGVCGFLAQQDTCSMPPAVRSTLSKKRGRDLLGEESSPESADADPPRRCPRKGGLACARLNETVGRHYT